VGNTWKRKAEFVRVIKKGLGIRVIARGPGWGNDEVPKKKDAEKAKM